MKQRLSACTFSNSLFSRKQCALLYSIQITLVVCLVGIIGDFSALDRSEGATENITMHWYDIRGLNPYELRAQMRLLGPKDFSDRSCYAFTRWKIEWTWPEFEDGMPDLKNATVKLKLDMTLPRWVDYDSAPLELQRKWDKFLRALKHHEDGHVKRAITAAEGIERALRAEESPDGHAAHSKIRSLISRHLVSDELYDTRSMGGLSQGVLIH
ncbi:MAG: DUF922 domain-containing protein [Bdellovibrionales bacterium]|nr:DUF922 domain-containing protein [Bdellovibrionales bacterium]